MILGHKFPKLIILNILKEWLVLDDLCMLDTAQCNHENRLVFLVILVEHGVVFSGTEWIPIGSAYLTWIQTRKLNIESLTIHTFANRALEGPLHCEQQLQRIQIENCTEQDIVTLQQITKLCVNLQELHIHCTCLTDTHLVDLLETPSVSLQTLDIANTFAFSSSISCIGFEHILNTCNRLTELNATGHNGLGITIESVNGTVPLTSTSGPMNTSLTSLNLNRTLIHDSYFQHILSRCSNLLTLHLQDCLWLTDDIIQQIGSYCPSLRELDVSISSAFSSSQQPGKITNTGINYLCERCKELTSLSATGSDVLDADIVVETLATQYYCGASGQVQCLTLSAPNPARRLAATATVATTATATAVANNGNNEGTTCLAEVTNIGFTSLAQSFPTLHSLHIDSFHLNDASITAITLACTTLHTLSFYSINVTDVGVCALSVNSQSRLTDLSMRCDVSDRGVLGVATQCTALTRLELKHCSKVSDGGITAIAYHCKRLRTLSLTSCPRITDIAVEEVAIFCTQLHELCIYSCGVSSASIRTIGLHCESLKVLRLYISSTSQKSFSQEISALKKKRKKLSVMVC